MKIHNFKRQFFVFQSDFELNSISKCHQFKEEEKNKSNWSCYERKNSREKILQKLYAICIYIESQGRMYARSVVFIRIICDSCYISSFIFGYSTFGRFKLYFCSFSLLLFVHRIIFLMAFLISNQKTNGRPEAFILINSFNIK